MNGIRIRGESTLIIIYKLGEKYDKNVKDKRNHERKKGLSFINVDWGNI
jgi:hypothetical protein